MQNTGIKTERHKNNNLDLKSIKLADVIIKFYNADRDLFQREKYLKNNTFHSHPQSKPDQQEHQQKEELSPFIKRILIVDDHPDVILTFKKGLEAENEYSSGKIFFQVYAYDDPLLALSEFKPNFYDLMLVDINMPKVNGFEFSEKILKLDVNVRICYVSAGEMNVEALREQYPSLSIGCFIRKPVTMENLVRRVKAELE
jgi:CheY-like chemotaxis protein